MERESKMIILWMGTNLKKKKNVKNAKTYLHADVDSVYKDANTTLKTYKNKDIKVVPNRHTGIWSNQMLAIHPSPPIEVNK